MDQKVCIFCGSNLAGKASVEHVLPQWLLDHLGIREREITPTHWNPQGEVLTTRQHHVGNLVEGRVCSTCNNGWMSTLEGQAKTLLMPLMEGNTEVVELTQDERLCLARWTCKTAFVLNSASNFHKNVPSDHFSFLYRFQDSLPLQVAVVAQQHHGDSTFYWLQMPFVLTSEQAGGLSLQEAEKLVAASYKVSFQFKKLLLCVAYWPWPNWRFILWPGIHVPLWPAKGPVAYYSADPIADGFPWNDSLQAQRCFHMTLAVIRQWQIALQP